jgi:hypothetical protein
MKMRGACPGVPHRSDGFEEVLAKRSNPCVMDTLRRAQHEIQHYFACYVPGSRLAEGNPERVAVMRQQNGSRALLDKDRRMTVPLLTVAAQ